MYPRRPENRVEATLSTRALAAVAVFGCAFVPPVQAQRPEAPDSARVYGLAEIVVTAERSPAKLSSSMAAVSVLRGEELVRGLAASAIVTDVSRIHLDDANTLALPDYTRVDARLSYPIGRARLSLEVRNLLDAEYSTTGFPDPSGSGAVYYYPAAGRTLEVGVTMGLRSEGTFGILNASRTEYLYRTGHEAELETTDSPRRSADIGGPADW